MKTDLVHLKKKAVFFPKRGLIYSCVACDVGSEFLRELHASEVQTPTSVERDYPDPFFYAFFFNASYLFTATKFAHCHFRFDALCLAAFCCANPLFMIGILF